MGLPRLWGKVGGTVAGEFTGSSEAHQLINDTVLGERSENTEGMASQAHVRTHSQLRRSGKLSQLEVVTKRGESPIIWTVAYYTILLGGVLAFWQGFWIFTRSERAHLDWKGR